MYELKSINTLMSKSKYLTATEEQELFTKFYNKDIVMEKLSDKLIRANIKFIVAIARKYKQTTTLILSDLISEGIGGYCEAMALYDDFSVRFNTYAVFWVKARISQYIEEHSFDFRISHNKAQEIRTALKEKKIAKLAGKEYTIPKNLQIIMNDMKQCFSMDCPIESDSSSGKTTYADIIESQQASEDMLNFENKDLKEFIQKQISCLSPTEQVVIRSWFNFYENNITFKELSERSGIKYNQLTTIRENAITKLKHLIKKEYI